MCKKSTFGTYYQVVTGSNTEYEVLTKVPGTAVPYALFITSKYIRIYAEVYIYLVKKKAGT